MASRDLMDGRTWSGQVGVQCAGTSKQSGERCKRWAVAGAAVCPFHGGSAPQVRAAARQRILGEVGMALNTLVQLAAHAESEVVRLRAADSLLDRAGLKAAEELQVLAAEVPAAQLDEAIAAWLEAQQGRE